MDKENERLYYVQDPRSYVGNSMLWWKHDNRGYTCEIRKARVFTETEIKDMDSIQFGEKVAYPKHLIDGRIQHHIDMQSCQPVDAYPAIKKRA